MLLKRWHAILIAVAIGLLAPLAFAQGEAVKPYFLVVIDTSGSMRDCDDPINPTPPCLGINRCGFENSRMSDAKCVFQRMVDGFGDVTFGLEHFNNGCSGAPSDSSCPTDCCTCATDCGPTPEVVVPVIEGNEDDLLKWVNFTIGNDCAPDPTFADPELMGGGGTPLGDSLVTAKDYFEGNDPRAATDPDYGSPISGDPFRGCRPYRVILLTDGEESCGGDPVGAATELRTNTVVDTIPEEILTYVVAFGVTPASGSPIEDIATAGGTDAPDEFFAGQRAFYAEDEDSLSNALSEIVKDAVKFEVCNGVDDDCDGQTDEGFVLYCNLEAGVTTPVLCEDPGDPCDEEDDNCYRGVEDEVRNLCGLCGPDCLCGVEVCNDIDDNCNGLTDEGFDLGTPCDRPDDEDLCENGVLTCSGCDETVEFPEVCDGIDNNCNGLTDEFVTRPCDFGCGEGTETCSMGSWVGCNAPEAQPETCDCRDNDCDGVVDNNTCRFPSVCLPPPYCVCAEPCGNEIPCPAGTVPSDPDLDSPSCFCTPDACAGVECPPTEDGIRVCVDGDCKPICEVNNCRAPLICDPSSGACVADDCGGCAEGQLCVGGTCAENPCAGVQCDAPQFCRGGECIDSCADVVCPTRQSCEAGVCADDLCADVTCPSWQVCEPDTGECRHDPCIEIDCGENQVCDSSSGGCVVNPCLGVRCPEGQACWDGNCWTPGQAAGERPRPNEFVLVSGEGGCGCSVGDRPRPTHAAWALLLLAPLLWRSRRWLGLALALLIGACEPSPYCVDCDPVETGADGGDGAECVDEECNGVDDDCDGFIDEGLSRPCGITEGSCQQGSQSCVAGVWGPCAGQVQPALEICDGIDNNCDGRTDEGFDLQNDPLNCGSCGNACSAEHGTATCDSGVCNFTCEPNWWDADEISGNGCEYFCVFVSDDEICNGLDENCDGVIDEPPLPGEGGECGNTTGECGAGTWRCVDGALACDGGQGPTAEICDNEDDDCDGITDNGFPGLGQPCSRGTGTCKTTGVFVCNATQDGIRCNASDPPAPGTEVCNGLDDDCDDVPDNGVVNRMVHVVDVGAGLDFWIDAYEASRPDATGQSPGTMSHRTCSEPNRRPWINVTYAEAQAACATTGARLCTEEEWQRACEAAGGTCGWSYGSACDTFAAGTCNGKGYDVDPGTPGDQDGIIATGELAQCYADWGTASDRVFDLSGNAKEWTEARSAGVNPQRGGAYNNTSNGISCGFDFTTGDDSFLFENVGFRCCRDTAP